MSKLAADLAAARVTGPKGAQKSSIIPELSGQGATTGLPGWSYFLPPERELAPAWTGRQRTETVESMLNDSQVTALWQAVRLPVHRYRIALDPRDADPVAVELLASDLGVPLISDTDERSSTPINQFSQRRHLDRALEALPYGHAVFEQTGYIDEAGYWRLQDLPPVPQWTIDDANSWVPDKHGKLVEVVQWGSNPPVKLKADHLVVFTWQGKPGDPRGRSMLRPLFGSFLMRDRTMRVMGMSAERTGMGIPVGKVSPGAVAGAREKMSSLLGGMAAGHDTNLVLETEGDIRHEVMLMGVTGQTPDLVAMLRYHDEAMARAMLAMVMQTGTTPNGSMAGSENLDNLLKMFHDAVVDWYCDSMTDQLIRRWVERNPVGDGIPRLVGERRSDEVAPAAEPVVDATVVEDEPARLPVAARRRGAVAASAAEPSLSRKQRATRSAFAATVGRDLRRDPSSIELAAAVDFATIEQQYVATQANVAAALVAIRDELTAVAVQQVAGMAEVEPLTLGDTLAAILEAHARAQDDGPLVALLVALAIAGVNQVVGEAARQGVELAASIDYQARAEADAADLMRRMARQVAESAASAARAGVPSGLAGGPASLVIAEHLGSLSSAAAEQAAAGAASRAQNAGRVAAIAAGDPISVVASEALDINTCGPCLLIDGREYATVADALIDYPAAGFRSCDGGERCRGTIFALFAITPETAPATATA